MKQNVFKHGHRSQKLHIKGLKLTKIGGKGGKAE